MAVFSIISRTKLDGPNRIDAEFYHPTNEALLSKLSMCDDLRTIGNCATVITDMGAFSLYRKDYLAQQGVPFLRVENIKDNFLDLSDVIYISPEYHAKLEKSQLKPRDVLLTTKANIGFACTVPENIGDCNMSQNLVRIRFKNFLNPYYVSTFLSSKYGSFQSKRLATGNVQLYLNYQNISRILIPIFSADFQNQIEKQVKTAESNLHNSQQILFQAEQLLLSELGLHAWKPRHTLTYVRSFSQVKQANRMDAEHFQPKYKELREIIRNYPCGYLKLIDIAVNSNETIEPRANPEHDFEYIELADINQTIGVIENAKIIKGKDAPSRARMLLRSGDIIASSVEGSLDKVALVSEEYDGAIGSTGFFVLRPRTVSSGYLLALIKSIIVREQMHCEASGTILSAVPAKSLKNIIVPNIPPEKQDEISALVQQSHTARREAKNLLEKAKRAVETAIEEGEERAMEYLNR